MTIEEIMSSTKEMLTMGDIAEILGSDPATLRETVRQYPERLKPLEPVMVGNRAKVPRMRFLGWYFGNVVPVQHMKGEREDGRTCPVQGLSGQERGVSRGMYEVCGIPG